MVDIRRILQHWPDAAPGVLVTLVHITGSSYRRPGARMLVPAQGAAAGTISGGCLESEVIRKAHWKVECGARVETYSTLFDDTAEIPYGLGCGGVVDLLFESTATPEAAALRSAMQASLDGHPRRVVTWRPSENSPLRRAIFDAHANPLFATPSLTPDELDAARSAPVTRPQPHPPEPATARADLDAPPSVPAETGERRDLFVEELAPPQRLILLGAGDDVQPLVRIAALLGWSVTVADGRAQLARPERFPTAERVLCATPGSALGFRSGDAVALMTHSYEQDRAWLQSLLALPTARAAEAADCSLTLEPERSVAAGEPSTRPGYIGLLGARHRSALLIREAADALDLSVEACCDRVWAPVGLDLGGDGPEAVALAITAEVQAWTTGRLARSRRLDAADVARQIAQGGASAYLRAQHCSAGLP